MLCVPSLNTNSFWSILENLFRNPGEIYLYEIDHHLCWVCKEDKLLWTAPRHLLSCFLFLSHKTSQVETKYHREIWFLQMHLRRDWGDLSQWEASIQVTWLLCTNERPVSWSRDHSGPMRGQYPGHVIPLAQWEARPSDNWPMRGR